VSNLVSDLARSAGEPVVVLPTLYHLMWTQVSPGVDTASRCRCDIRGAGHTSAGGSRRTVSSAAKIRVGDFCRYDNEFCELIALDGAIAKLQRSDGHQVAVKLPELFADSAFEVVSPRVRRRPIAASSFGSLTIQAQERAL
jgi:hypothetical protein